MVWLMLAEFSFTTTYQDSQNMEHQVLADDVMFEVRLSRVGICGSQHGFLSTDRGTSNTFKRKVKWLLREVPGSLVLTTEVARQRDVSSLRHAWHDKFGSRSARAIF